MPKISINFQEIFQVELLFKLLLMSIYIKRLSMKEVKCPNCKTWNSDIDHCSTCGEPISSKQLNLNYKKQIDEIDNKRPPSIIDTYLAKQMKSSNAFVRVLFYFLYSIWMVYMAILGFFLYIIVGTPG